MHGKGIKPLFWLCASQLLPLAVVSHVRLGGSWPANPLLLLLAAEVLKTVFSVALKFCLKDAAGSARSDVVVAANEASGASQGTLPAAIPTRSLLMQIVGLSTLNVLCYVLFFFLLSTVPAPSFALAQTLSTLTSGILGALFLQDSLTAAQILTALLHITAVVVALWDACGGGALTSFGALIGVVFLTFLQLVAHTWQQTLIRHSGASTAWISTFTALFSIPLTIFALVLFPGHTFASTSVEDLIPSLHFKSALAIIGSLSIGSVCLTFALAPDQSFDISSLSPSLHFVSVATMTILYTIDFFYWKHAYMTLTVGIALLTVAICSHVFCSLSLSLSSSSSDAQSSARIRPTLKHNLLRGDKGELKADHLATSGASAEQACSPPFSNFVPPFVANKCSWRRILLYLFITFLMLISINSEHAETGAGAIGEALGLEDITGGNGWLSGGTPKTEAAPIEHIPSQTGLIYNPDGLPLVGQSIRDISLPTGAQIYIPPTKTEHFYNWDSKNDDEAVEELVEAYLAERGDETLTKKSVAVCLVGNMGKEFLKHDLEVLRALHNTIGDKHDVFVWQGRNSLPYKFGRIHPLAVSLAPGNPPPDSISKRYKIPASHALEWWDFLGGIGTCTNLIQKHSAKRNVTYDWTLVLRTTLNLHGRPIPSVKTWNDRSITFAPHPKDTLAEAAIWGPTELMLKFGPLLQPGAKAFYQLGLTLHTFSRHFAQSRNFSVTELEHWR